jgi:hypothetical protein
MRATIMHGSVEIRIKHVPDAKTKNPPMPLYGSFAPVNLEPGAWKIKDRSSENAEA